MTEGQFPVHRDERGELVVVEGACLDFPIKRVFTVSGADGARSRGGHVADCTEVVLLVAGAAVFVVGPPGPGSRSHTLDAPGQSLRIESGTHVEYVLSGSSVITVLCDAPYGRRR